MGIVTACGEVKYNFGENQNQRHQWFIIVVMMMIIHLRSDDERSLGNDKLARFEVSSGDQVAAELWWATNLQSWSWWRWQWWWWELWRWQWWSSLYKHSRTICASSSAVSGAPCKSKSESFSRKVIAVSGGPCKRKRRRQIGINEREKRVNEKIDKTFWSRKSDSGDRKV